MKSASSAARNLQRRTLLTAPLLLLACESRRKLEPHPSHARTSSAAAQASAATPADSAVELKLERLGDAEKPYQHVVILLHGFSAAGDVLVPLGQRLARPGVRFLVPAAPLPQGNGRAWWYFDPADRPAQAWSDQLPEGYREHPRVKS